MAADSAPANPNILAQHHLLLIVGESALVRVAEHSQFGLIPSKTLYVFHALFEVIA